GIVISTITLTLQDLTVGTSYYNGLSWVSGGTSFPAQGTVANWSFNNASLSFVNDHQYQLTAVATDNSAVTATTNFTFVYDVQKPTSSITSPLPGYLTTTPLTTISGKANDQIGSPTNPSGIFASSVAVAIQQVGGNWWNGASFAAANPIYSTASFVGAPSGTWSYSVPVALQNALVSGTTYFIVSRSTDNAANTEFGATAGAIPGGVGITIIYDTATPTAVFTVPNYGALPAAKAFNTIGTVSGTASADVGVQSVQVAILKLGAPSLWFDGTNFTKPVTNIPYFLNATGTTNWTYPGSASLLTALQSSGDHAQYVFVASATALSGLTQSVFAVGTSSFTLTYDKTAPTASIGVPTANNLSYKRANIGQGASLLSGASSDTGPLASGVKDVGLRLSYLLGGNTYYWTGAAFSSSTVTPLTAWQPITTAGAWTYGISIVWPADGISHAITFEARAEDNSLVADGSGTGNIDVPSTVGTDVMNFTIDDILPTSTITWPSANAAISSATVQMTGPATHDLSGVNLVQVEISTGLGGSKFYYNGAAWQA